MRNEVAQIIQREQVMELVYGNSNHPKDILGRHMVSTGQVISAFHPDATEMYVIDDEGNRHRMDPVERLPLFAIFFPTRRTFEYKIDMLFPDGNHFISEDPYSFPSGITPEEEQLFTRGIWKNCYRKMGAHSMKMRGVEGVYFAVWAPNAQRVSVVGDFNYWNGMIYPMQQLQHSGIFELFIPGVREKQLYRYEIKSWEKGINQKVDPFGNINLDGAGDASIILNLKEFRWTDQQWIKDRRRKDWKQVPISVCDREIENPFWEEFCESGCFTHVLLKAPECCHGMRGKVREWIDYLHGKGIGVLLRLSLGWFPDEENGLKYFDGTPLFGYADSPLRFDKDRKKIRFRYDRKEIINYLTSHLLFWMKEYHVDGFLFEGITDMIDPLSDMERETRPPEYDRYLEEAEEFLCGAVKEIKKEDFSIIVIGDEKREKDHHFTELTFNKAPFDALINYGVPENLREYVADFLYRQDEGYYRLSLPLMKNGVRFTLLDLVPDEEILLPASHLDNIPLNEYDRLSWKKLMIGYMLGTPGRKRWSGKEEEPADLHQFIKSLFRIYTGYPCMYLREPLVTSFSWINGMDARNLMISFIRRSPGGSRNLLFLCNFSRERKEGFRVGVPKYGRYKMLVNSDWEEFGGAIKRDEVVLTALSQQWDLQPYSLRVTISGLSVLIFEY